MRLSERIRSAAGKVKANALTKAQAVKQLGVVTAERDTLKAELAATEAATGELEAAVVEMESAVGG